MRARSSAGCRRSSLAKISVPLASTMALVHTYGDEHHVNRLEEPAQSRIPPGGQFRAWKGDIGSQRSSFRSKSTTDPPVPDLSASATRRRWEGRGVGGAVGRGWSKARWIRVRRS